MSEEAEHKIKRPEKKVQPSPGEVQKEDRKDVLPPLEVPPPQKVAREEEVVVKPIPSRPPSFEVRPQVTCQICGRVFSSVQRLRDHVASDHTLKA